MNKTYKIKVKKVIEKAKEKVLIELYKELKENKD